MTTAAQVLAVLDGLVDPCSEATGKPMSIVTMGLVRESSIAIDGDSVTIALVLTDPLCAFFREIAGWIEREVGALGFRKVVVTTASELWTPARIVVRPIVVAPFQRESAR